MLESDHLRTIFVNVAEPYQAPWVGLLKVVSTKYVVKLLIIQSTLLWISSSVL